MSTPSLRTLAQLGCIYGIGGNTLLVDELFDLQEDVRVMEGVKWVGNQHTRSRVFFARSETHGCAMMGMFWDAVCIGVNELSASRRCAMIAREKYVEGKNGRGYNELSMTSSKREKKV